MNVGFHGIFRNDRLKLIKHQYHPYSHTASIAKYGCHGNKDQGTLGWRMSLPEEEDSFSIFFKCFT